MKRKPQINFKFLIFIMIIASMILVYASDFGGIKTDITNTISKINIQEDSYCKNNIFIEEIKIYTPYKEAYEENKFVEPTIVHTLLVSEVIDNYPKYWGKSPFWKDGTEMEAEMSVMGIDIYSVCHNGERKGENMNYLYCENLEYHKENQNIAEDGTILDYEKRNYLISIEIDKNSIKEEKIYRRAYLPGPENKQVIAGILTTYKIVNSECKRIKPYE